METINHGIHDEESRIIRYFNFDLFDGKFKSIDVVCTIDRAIRTTTKLFVNFEDLIRRLALLEPLPLKVHIDLEAMLDVERKTERAPTRISSLLLP